jgi:hypothetical protein
MLKAKAGGHHPARDVGGPAECRSGGEILERAVLVLKQWLSALRSA